MRPSRQFSRFNLYSGSFARGPLRRRWAPRLAPPDLLGQSTEPRFRIRIRKGSLGNDRAHLLYRMPQNVLVFRLQQANEVRPLDPRITTHEGQRNFSLGEADGLFAPYVRPPLVLLPRPDEQDPGEYCRVGKGSE